MRGLFTSVRALCTDLWLDAKDGAFRHLDIYFPRALYLKLPGTRLSAFLEWRETNVGWSTERRHSCIQIWCGRLDAVFCMDALEAQA